MREGTDVFIVGGGPAGLAAAIAARRRGFDVMLADGAEPPIGKACGEGLMPDALAALRKLGIIVSTTEGFPFRGIRFLEHGVQVESNFPVGHGIGLPRPVLHQKMIEQARQMGVTLLWKTPVTALCSEGVTAGGQTIAAPWVVGADGIGSRVRRWAGLDVHSGNRLRYACRRHYFVEPWSDRIEIYWTRDGQAYVTPVGERHVCVVLISSRFGMRFASLGNAFPALAERLALATGVDRERGAVTATVRLDRVCHEHVALIGDASGSVDAITGDGLYLSFQQAEALADALEAGDLRHYQKAHRRLARRPALMGQLMLLLDGNAALRHRAMSAMAADPTIFERLLAVHVGESSPSYLAATGALLGWRLVAA